MFWSLDQFLECTNPDEDMKTCCLSDALFEKDEDNGDLKQWDMNGINELLSRRKELQIILTMIQHPFRQNQNQE